MPQQRFPIRSGGPKQIVIHWKSNLRDLSVELDGHVLATFDSCTDLVNGVSFELGPAASLAAWWIEATESTRIELNGVAIRGGSEVHPDIADAAPMVFGIGAFNLVAGQLAVYVYGMASLDVVFAGLALLGLGVLVRQGSRRALGVAIGVLLVSLILKVVMMFGDSPKMLPLATVIAHIALGSAMVRSYLLATTDW